MVQLMSSRALSLPIDEQFTAAAQRWSVALSTAQAHHEAQLYGYVVALLAEQFKPVTTVRALVQFSAAPHPAVLQRLLGLCELSGVELDPHVALYAACALRLRQLQDGALA